MRGKTHSQIGFLTYIVLVVLPIGTFTGIFKLVGLGTNKLDLFAVAFAYLGGLFPDTDIIRSKINYHQFKIFNKYPKIQKFMFKLYYLFLGVSFIAFGIYIRAYSLQLIKVVIGGIFLIMIPRFPHRTLTHTPEGMLMAYMGVSYITNLTKTPQYGVAFMVGYFSHLYLTDLLTKRGVYISIIPYILRKLKPIIPKKIWVKISRSSLYKNMNKSISLHLMSTGSKRGDFFENLYTTVFYLLTIICILKFGLYMENKIFSIYIPKI